MNAKALLKWFNSREGRQGGIKIIPRRNGDALLFRWMIGRVNYSRNFAAGTPDDFVKARILEIESQLLDRRNGIGVGPVIQRQRRASMTLKEFGLWYIETSWQEGKARETILNCEYVLRRLIRFLGSERFAVDNITQDQLNDFTRHLLETNSRNAARTVLRKLHTVFEKGRYEKKILCAPFPFDGFKYPEAEEPKQKPILTLAEMKDVSRLFGESSLRLAWDISRLTGLRGNDILNLDADRFDLNNGILNFRMVKMNRDEKLLLHPALVDILRPYIRRGGKLFAYKWNGILSDRFGEKIRELKGDSFRPSGSHTPRNSLASYLRNKAKWPVSDIALFLGHRPRSVTQRSYTHDDIVEILREKLDKLPLDGG